MLSLQVKRVMEELGIDADVTHTDLTTAAAEQADYYIGASEIMDQLRGYQTISIKNMFQLDEIKQAIQEKILND